MAFYQKYRSKTFSELIGQEHIAETLLYSVKNNKAVHAYLFTGPRGIGKTSTARLMARALNCTNLTDKGEPCNSCASCLEITSGRSIDVLEIDAASHTGVDDVREIIEKARLAPASAKKKVYIIDEVHMLSKSAFNALLKTLEEPPSHAVFIMATTEVQKIPATVLSRAQRYDFKRATKEEIIKNLKRVSTAEGIKIDDTSLDLIAVSAAGGHRDALSLLEQVASKNKEITQEITHKILGITGGDKIFDFIWTIFNKIPEEGLKIVHEIYDSGLDITCFNKSVIEILRKTLLVLTTKEKLFDETEEANQKIADLAQKVGVAELIRLINIFIESGNLLKDVNYPILPIEMAVVKASVQVNQLVSESVNQQNSESVSQSLDCARDKLASEQVDQSNSKSVSQSASESVFRPITNNQSPITEGKLSNQQSNTVPVPVLEMTRDIWQQIIEKVRSENATLAALLKDASPEGLTADTLTLGVKFKFHKERISEAKNCEILEGIVTGIVGEKCKVVCKIAGPKVKEINPVENVEEAVKEIFEVE